MNKALFSKALFKVVLMVAFLSLVLFFSVRPLNKVTVEPQTLTLPVALKLAAIKTIHIAIRTNGEALAQYSPWYVTYKDGSTKTFNQCAQMLPEDLFATTLTIDIGGNQVSLENYPIRAAFTNSPYHQSLITLLQCIGDHS